MAWGVGDGNGGGGVGGRGKVSSGPCALLHGLGPQPRMASFTGCWTEGPPVTDGPICPCFVPRHTLSSFLNTHTHTHTDTHTHAHKHANTQTHTHTVSSKVSDLVRLRSFIIVCIVCYGAFYSKV